MAKKSSSTEDLEEFDTYEFYVDPGSLNRIKGKKEDEHRFFKLTGRGRRQAASTTISVWQDEQKDKGDKKIIVKVYVPKSESRIRTGFFDYVFLLALIGLIVVGYFLLAVR